MRKHEAITCVPPIESVIRTVRGHKVVLDADLAFIYGIDTKFLNRAVKRNAGRFPEDFVFQLTVEESIALRCQNGTSNHGRGGRRYLPYVFTEYGAIMAASAEVDYVIQQGADIVPIEVKAGTRGQMQSLYRFMSERGLQNGVRVSLENFAQYDRIQAVPMYAVRRLAQVTRKRADQPIQMRRARGPSNSQK